MLSEVPDDWDLCRLADLAQIKIGGTPSRSVDAFWDKTGNGEAWVSIADLKQRIVTTTNETITALGVEKSNVKKVPAGTILMSFKLTVGRVSLAGHDMYTNEAIAALDLSEGVQRDYLYQCLPTFVDNVQTEQAVKGKTLNKKSLAEIPIILPPLNEQHRIAEVLSSVDESIQATQAVIDQAERVKQGLMEELLTCGLGSAAIERGEVPEGWRVSQLEEAVMLDWGDTSITKKSYTETGFTAYSATGGDGKLPHFDYNSEGVVVSAIGANSGKVFLAKGKWSAIKNTMVAFGKDDNATTKYFYYLAQMPGFWPISGGAQPFIGLKNAKKRRLVLPSINHQERIADILASVDDFIAKHRATIEQQKRIKQGLMDDLLTGKVRIV